MTLANRVSLFFLAALAVCLLGFSLLSYLLIRHHLYERFDHDLAGVLQVLSAAVEVEADGVKWQPTEHAIPLDDSHNAASAYWIIIDEQSNRVDQSRNLTEASAAEAPLQKDATKALLKIAKLPFAEGESNAGPIAADDWRLAKMKLTASMPNPPALRDPDEFAALTVIVARDASQLHGDLWRLAALFLLLPIVVWLTAAAVGRLVVRQALRPLSEMSHRARSTTKADFQLRLPVAKRNDELAELATAFNGLLDRLRQAFDQQRHFTTDAAHQLRTPLTVLLGQIDVALRRPREAGEYREVLLTLHGQTEELRQLVESLLFLARSEEESSQPTLQQVELSQWLSSYMAHWKDHPRAADFREEFAPNLPVKVSPPLLAQAMDNLIGNAVKYSQPGTPITVRTIVRDKQVGIEIRDEGIGIAAGDRELIFQPFYRSTQARQSGTEGTGLGLALVARISKALGGSVEYTENQPAGSCFTIYLPSSQS